MNSAQGGLLSLIENSTSEVIGWGAVEEKILYQNSQFVVVKAETTFGSAMSPRAASDGWQSHWAWGPSELAFQCRESGRSQ